MGGGRRDKNKGDYPPKLPLENKGGFHPEDGEEARGGEVEEPAGGVHGNEAAGKMGEGPPAEMAFEKIRPTGGAHEPGRRSGLNSDFFPAQVLHVGVLFKIPLEHDEDGADHGGVILKADLGDEIGNDVEQAVGVNDGERGRGRRGVGDILVGTLGEVLDDIREELELFDKVGELGGVNLGEFRLQHGEAVKKIVHDLRGDAGSPALGKGGDFSHSPRVKDSPPDGKRRRGWIPKKVSGSFPQ